jgi:hypothetical protein
LKENVWNKERRKESVKETGRKRWKNIQRNKRGQVITKHRQSEQYRRWSETNAPLFWGQDYEINYVKGSVRLITTEMFITYSVTTIPVWKRGGRNGTSPRRAVVECPENRVQIPRTWRSPCYPGGRTARVVPWCSLQ